MPWTNIQKFSSLPVGKSGDNVIYYHFEVKKMKKKLMKWALPALLMSALTFEIMPGSVACYGSAAPEGTWNFFTLPVEGTPAACLVLAAAATFVAMVLALVAACFKKDKLYILTSWCSLGGATLAAMPYTSGSAELFVQPNVVVLLILMVCWLLAMSEDKKSGSQEESRSALRRK